MKYNFVENKGDENKAFKYIFLQKKYPFLCEIVSKKESQNSVVTIL